MGTTTTTYCPHLNIRIDQRDLSVTIVESKSERMNLWEEGILASLVFLLSGCTVQYCTVHMYSTVLYTRVLNNRLLYECTVLYESTGLYCTVLYCTVHV